MKTINREQTMSTQQVERNVWNALQLWDTNALIDGIACTKRGSWLARAIANELVSRGIGHDGEWVGFEKARRIWVDADR